MLFCLTVYSELLENHKIYSKQKQL